jgi:hypothetical protein
MLLRLNSFHSIDAGGLILRINFEFLIVIFNFAL